MLIMDHPVLKFFFLSFNPQMCFESSVLFLIISVAKSQLVIVKSLFKGAFCETNVNFFIWNSFCFDRSHFELGNCLLAGICLFSCSCIQRLDFVACCSEFSCYAL